MSNYIFWNVDPEIINIYGISLRYYSLLFITGLILSVAVLRKIYKIENLDVNNIDKIFFYSLFGVVLGARLGHCLFYEPGYYFSHPLEILLPIVSTPDGSYKFSGFQGLASHGGAVGLILALLAYKYKAQMSFIKILDHVAIIVPIGAFFIRLGNLMNSEIIGRPSTLPWAFIFAKVDNIPRHPSQLYEAIAYFFIFIIMITLYNYKKEKLPKGFLFGLSISLIFTARFFIEFLKENQSAFENGMLLDMGQILSIPFVVVGLVFMFFPRIARKSL